VIVAGADLVVSLFVEQSDTAIVERVFDRDSDWCAPLIWRSMFRTVLIERCRQGVASVDGAFAAIRAADSIFHEREFQPNGEHVLRLAMDSGCCPQSCEFVAVARDLGLTLVTADEELLRAFAGLAVSPAAFVRA
jgi:predicted nucleic acid-binding protein